MGDNLLDAITKPDDTETDSRSSRGMDVVAAVEHVATQAARTTTQDLRAQSRLIGMSFVTLM